MLPQWYIDFTSKKNSQYMNELNGKTVLFLDTNIWINLRNCFTGIQEDDRYRELYDILKRKDKDNTCICLLSESTYFELLKRNSRDDLIAVFSVVNDLAKDLMQTNIEIVCKYELLNYINRVKARLYVNKIQSQYINFQIYFDDNATVSEIESNKEIIEAFIETPMSDLLKIDIPNVSYYSREFINPAYYLLKKSIEIGSKRNYASYEALRKSETRSILETLKTRYEAELSMDTITVDEVIKDQDINNYMPYINTSSSLYALIRWSELPNLSTNDMYDLINFPCALGYSDYYFAESKYINRLKQKPLSLYAMTKTKLESDVGKMIGIAEEI